MKTISLLIIFSFLLAACAPAGNSVATESLTATPMTESTPTRVSTPTPETGKTYYVRPDGSDTKDGLSTETAFQTIQHAHDLTEPGDTVLVMDGTYTETSGEGVLVITRSGSADAYITYKAYPGHQPKLHTATAWNHILVAGAAYIKIEGFEVEGNNANINVEQANAIYEYMVKANKDNSVDWDKLAPTSTNGIFIRTDDDGHIPHHIEVRNNTVHDCPGGGIGSADADYITIEDNVVFNNAYYAVFATSGISLWLSRDIDQSTGVKNLIQRNRVYGNETRVKWYLTEDWSDGNGIIIDSFLDQDEYGGAYQGRTLVSNNISVANGGSGIHCFNSANVDIVNNTAYKNSKNPNLSYGSIFASQCKNVNILNNILFARPGKPINDNSGNTNTRYDYNIYFNGLAPEVLGPHDLQINPGFISGNENLAEADFHLAADSFAIGHGTDELAPQTDLDGIARPQGQGVDIGAYETAGDTVPRIVPTAMPTATASPLVIGATIPAVDVAPVIDGAPDSSWIGATQPIKSAVVGDKPDAANLSGSWTAVWDANALYVQVNVTDDKLISDSNDSWEDDSVEVYIDGGAERAAAYDTNDFTYRFQWNNPKVIEMYGSSTAGIRFAQKKTATGYLAEIAIPWQTVGVSPSDGKILGLDVHINDDDDGNGRDGKLTWFGAKDNGWNTPSAFGVVQLTGASNVATVTPVATATPEPGWVIVDDAAPDVWTYTGSFGDNIVKNSDNLGGTRRDPWQDGDSAEITFTGTQVKIYGVKFPGAVTADIYIDDMTTPLAAGVSWDNPSTVYRTLIWASPVLSSGKHTLKIICRGDYISFDFISYK